MTDPLRKSLLDWYHNRADNPSIRSKNGYFEEDEVDLFAAIEEVYGVEVTKKRRFRKND